MSIRLVPSLLLIAIVVAGCAQPELPQYRVHHSLLESPQAKAPKKVLVLPVDVVINEVTAGGVSEEVADWSRKGSENVLAALNRQFRVDNKNLNKIQLIEAPKFTDRDAANIKQHLALYRRVAGTVFDTTYGQGAWPHKIYNFDYTLGNGLKSVADHTGADTALILIGEDSVSTTGRKIAAFFMDSVSYGHSFLSAAIVSLRTGDILWFNYIFEYKSTDLREQDDAAKLVAQLFEEYPGIEQYKEARVPFKEYAEQYTGRAQRQ